MVVKALLVVLQTLLFLLLFGIGSFLPAFTSFPNWQIHTGAHRAFVLDGLVLAVAACVLILLIEAARKRLRGPGGLTTLALVLALALGFAMKFGFRTV
jgi:hypothetical protein